MSIEIIDLDNGLGNIIIGKDIITAEEYRNKFTAHLSQSEDKLKLYRYSLADYTEVSRADLSSEDIRFIAQQCTLVSKKCPDIVLAMVAGNDLFYGLARMSEMLMHETSWDIMVFRKIDEAIDWVKRELAVRYGLTDIKMEPN